MTPTTTHPSRTGAALSDSDPRRGFATALALGGTAIANVAPDQLDCPTPCTGEDVTSVPAPSEIGDTQWTEAWTHAVREVLAAWSDPDVLERTMVVPFGQLSGAATIAVYTGEVTIHTWDLATATDQRPAWDDGTVAAALVAYRRVLPPTRPPGVPFGPAVAIDDDRPLIEVLAAWSGRRP